MDPGRKRGCCIAWRLHVLRKTGLRIRFFRRDPACPPSRAADSANRLAPQAERTRTGHPHASEFCPGPELLQRGGIRILHKQHGKTALQLSAIPHVHTAAVVPVPVQGRKTFETPYRT